MLRDLIKLSDTRLIKEYIEDIHAFDLSLIFNELSEEEREHVYKHINDEKLSELVAYLDPDFAAEILVEFDIEKQKRLVEMMEPDDAADIIMELDSDEKDELLEILGDDSDISKLISYDESETGSAMTNLFIEIHPDMDVKKATKKVIKEAREVESINTIFVTDDHGLFLGVVPLKKLLKAKTPLEINEIIEEFPYTFDKMPIEQTVQSIRNYGIYEMPVLNEKHELVGMITLDDALDIYKEEAKEDFEKLAGLPEILEDSTFFKTAVHRIPWLLTLLLIMIPISLVTHSFEYTLSQVAILIVFQPLILGSAGNVATQTLAVTLRMFSTNEKGLFKNSYREILTGMMNGFAIGLIAFVMTILFGTINQSLATNSILIAFVVGISLWITVIIAPIVAILIPLTLRSLKFDPAVASGPFITTIIDVAAIVIYFGLAILMGVTG